MWPFPTFIRFLGIGIISMSLLAGQFLSAQRSGKNFPYVITIKDGTSQNATAPELDPVERVQIGRSGNLAVILYDQAKRAFHNSHYPSFSLDDSIIFSTDGNGDLAKAKYQELSPPKKGSGYSVECFVKGLRIQLAVLVAATKPTVDKKGRMDAVLIRYLVENQDVKSHKVGLRIYLEPEGDNAIFSSGFPRKRLDGAVLHQASIPRYAILESANPACLTLDTGAQSEKPDRFFVTARQNSVGVPWNLSVQRGGKYCAFGLFWDPRPIAPGEKREMGYAYGHGILLPDSSTNLKVVLGGSFEPGKLFTVTAYVQNPVPGQNLKLELPPAITRIEGKEEQPIPVASTSVVMWKARVSRTGVFTLRVVSSTGSSRTKLVTVERSK